MKLKRLNKDVLSERINRFLYDSRPIVLKITRVIVSVAILGGFIVLTYAYGFDPRGQTLILLLQISDAIFTLLVLSYLIRWLYAFRRTEFLRSTRFEAVFIALIFINGIMNLFFNNFVLMTFFRWLGAENYYLFYEQFITIILFIILILELARIGASLGHIKINPSIAFVLSFVVIIVIGTILLMLPAMTTAPGGMPWLDALFTSVSATCVTGLIVVDTATYFTFRGQFVILLLIQTGGLGIVTFATFFASFLRSGVGFRHRDLIPDYLDTETVSSARTLLRQIVFLTFFIELLAFLLIFFTWSGIEFDSMGEKIFYSAFHAISAFCNAGFSIFTGGLYEPGIDRAYLLHIAIAVTLILGSLGFSTVQDIFSPQRLRDRLAHPWKEWRLSTKISVNVAAFLLVVGTIGFYFLEKGRSTLAELNLSEALIASFFQSATTRTAGFNTVDFTSLAPPTLILMMFLMFIGGNSGSTAGGIKTSTFYIIVASVITTSQGRSKLFIGNRYIPTEVIYKSLSIFFYAVATILIGVFCLSITEPETDILDLTFEQVSAFATVGLSTGVTGTLSAAGKVVIIITMFLGRVGILTFAVALSRRKANEDFKLPSANIMVG